MDKSVELIRCIKEERFVCYVHMNLNNFSVSYSPYSLVKLIQVTNI